MEGKAERFEFSGFVFDATDKVLFRDDEIVGLPPKTCELLAVLIANAGRIVTRKELMELVWPDTFVEEANLSHHVTVLRKALANGTDNDLIETVPRKGYRFTVPVRIVPEGGANITVIEQRTAEMVEVIKIEDRLAGASALPPGRHAAKWPFVMIGMLLVAAGISGYFILTRSSATAETPTVRTPSQMRLTNSGRVGVSSISPDGKFVAYAQNHTEGVGTLYIRQTETNIESVLATHDKGEFGMTTFTPDGAFVFYAVRTTEHPSMSLYRVAAIGGSTPVKLIDELPSNHFALSPDGSEVVALRNDDRAKTSGLVAIRTDGTAVERPIVTRSRSELFFGDGTAWSPDGKRLVVPFASAEKTSNYSRNIVNVATVDLATGSIENLTNETWSEVGMMRWMPDASGVVVIGARPQLRNQIYFISSATGEVERITNDTHGYGNYGLGITKDGTALVVDVWEFDARIWRLDADGEGRPAVRFAGGNPNTLGGLAELADGRVVFAARTNFTYDLWTATEKETDAKALTSDPYIDTHVSASPDGSFLLFASDRAGVGTKHLFRMNTDGSEVRQLTFGDNQEDAPDLSPDGKWILYQSNTFDATGTLSTSIQKMAAPGGEAAKVLDGCFVPSFSPDGKMFACVAPQDNYRGRLIVGNLDGEVRTRSFEVDYFFQAQLPVRWTPDGGALVFRKAENQVTNLWRQPIAGGPPTKLTDLKSENIFNYCYSRDGKHLFLSRGNTRVNVVMFINFK